MIPTNTVEEVARDKIVAELLDRVCERGYLRIGICATPSPAIA